MSLSVLAASPLGQPRVPHSAVPGFIFTASVCAFFAIWAIIVAVLAYRGRGQRHQLHGGAWGVRGPWRPPVYGYSARRSGPVPGSAQAPVGPPPGYGAPPPVRPAQAYPPRHAPGSPPPRPQAPPPAPPGVR